MKGMLTIEELIGDLLANVLRTGESKASLARRSKLHPNTLRWFGDQGWNPSAATLRRLEQALLPNVPPQGASKRLSSPTPPS